MLNVFHRDRRTIRHFWASELLHAPVEGDLRSGSASRRHHRAAVESARSDPRGSSGRLV
jgi:hypothetical protein